jgi:hypothetical protein
MSGKNNINNATKEFTTSSNRIGMEEFREENRDAVRVTKVAGIIGYGKFMAKIASV